MNAAALTTALAMGFLGSFHCAGMCGPIMLILPFGALSGWRKMAGIAFYHLGRVSVYAAMGLVLHSFKSLFHPGWQQAVSISLGCVMLLTGLYSFLSAGRAAWLPQAGFVRKWAARFMGNPSLPALTIAGALNGMLPCGLVYMALSLSVAAFTTADAALVMYAFGLGTVPMLVSIVLLKRKWQPFFAGSLRRYVPVLLFTLSGLFLLRGMALGIPYLSPKVAVEGKTIKSSCCHKQ